MATNSMGEFICALRKSKGMTQQDIADRLHVSNKAVSRWERGECAPDLSLIPALAELLEVTCDELLRGERIAPSAQMQKPPAEKQITNLLRRSLSDFQNMLYLAFALCAVGLICMFGIAYGFYRPIIGFFVMLLFEAGAVTVAVIAINRLKSANADQALWAQAAQAEQQRYQRNLHSLSFGLFFAVLSVIFCSAPLAFALPDFASVISLQSYITHYFGWCVLFLAGIFLLTKMTYTRIVQNSEIQHKKPENPMKATMNLWQISLILCAGIILLLSPYLSISEQRNYSTIGSIITLICLFGSIIVFIFFTVKAKENRSALLCTGIRNVLYIPSVFLFYNAHKVGWVQWSDGDTILPTERFDRWYPEYILCALLLALIVTGLFAAIEKTMQKS